jgi:hypothetical protein
MKRVKLVFIIFFSFSMRKRGLGRDKKSDSEGYKRLGRDKKKCSEG